MMFNRTGQQFGNYRLVRSLGRGGFAEVYLAEHVHLQTYAAAKILHGSITPRDLQTFTHEARIIARLQHPNIIRVIDFGGVENIPFLIMEYAPHGTLRNKHPRGEKVPLSVVVSYVKQLAHALDYAHGQRIIHRDIKPENMLVGKQQEILLSDFGVSAIVHNTSSQSTNSVAGTIVYMAPEQIQGRAVPASDQYALAVVVYEWLCGTPPFSGSYPQVAFQHYTTPPPSLYQYVPTIPAAVELVVLKALAKSPQERFTTVQDFVQALEQACAAAALTRPAYPSGYIPQQGERLVSFPPDYAPHRQDSPIKASGFRRTSQPGTFISRRTMITGLAGLALVGGAGAVFFARNSLFPNAAQNIGTQNPIASRSPSPTHPASTPSPSSPPAIYAGGTDNFLYALHPNDGSIIWSFQARNWMNSRPVVGNGVVYAGSNDAFLYAFRAKDGTSIWKFQTGGQIVSWPMLVNDILYFGSWDASVYAVRTKDGSVSWNYKTGGQISSPTQVVDGVVYIGSNDSNLYAFQASNGNLLWQFPTGGAIAALATVSQGVVYVGSADHNLYAIRAADGTGLWHFQTGDTIFSAPEIANGVLYIGSSDHYLYALRLSDQTMLWRFQTGGAVASLPTYANGVLYISSSDGYVYALQTQDGTLIWRYQTNGVVSSKAILANGIVYVGASNGLFALRAKDGSLAWKFGNAAFTTPALAF